MGVKVVEQVVDHLILWYNFSWTQMGAEVVLRIDTENKREVNF